jgi:hypothetical protein
MPILSPVEVRKVAETLTNLVLAGLIDADPTVKKALNRVALISSGHWQDAVENLFNQVEDVLLNKFGST